MSPRTCRGCAADYTVDRPTKGRRLCDGCLSTRKVSAFTCQDCGERRRLLSAERDPLTRRPVRCWDCRDERTALTDTTVIVGRVSRVESSLDGDTITAAVLRAAPSRDERRWLATHLRDYPDALTSQAAEVPKVLPRLVVALLAAGAANVRLPLCPRCQRPARVLARGRTHCEDRCARELRATGCAVCGAHRPPAGRSAAGEPVCRTCWRTDPARHEPCTFCGQLRAVNARTDTGAPVCTACYSKHLQPARTCGGCGEARTITATVEGRPSCARCYQHPRRACGVCRKVKRIKVRASATSPDLCGGCQWGTVATCTRCGQLAEGWGARRGAHVCLTCAARGEVDAILTHDGQTAGPLAGLRDAFLAAEQPRSVLLWTRRSPGAALLRRLATGDLPLTHAALDALPRTPSTRHLHALLVATGALPERDHYLANLDRAVAALVAGITDQGDARLVRGYARWHVSARLRRRAPAAGVTFAQADNARDRITEAVRFLAFLRGRGRDLAACTQTDVDAWTAEHRVEIVRPFLTWAAARDHAPDLDLPDRARPRVTGPADHDARWTLARRLLHDDGIDPADRVAGALVVLYAQPLTRVAALRLDDIHDVDGQVHVSFGKDRVHMPDPLGDLLRALPWRRQVGPSGHAPSADAWLFPGRNADHHQHPDHLSARLRALGIEARAMRRTALFQLGAAIPPAVLAEMLNLHPSTAVGWAKAAAGAWTNYAALRAFDGASPEARL